MKKVARTIRFLNSLKCSNNGIRPSADNAIANMLRYLNRYFLAEAYFSAVGVSPFLSSSLFNSLTSLLKIRSDRPNERAESGKRLAPKSTITTKSRIKICDGSRRNIAHPLLITMRRAKSPRRLRLRYPKIRHFGM